MAAKEAPCSLCGAQEMTGFIALIRLRTSKVKEHVTDGPMTCDPCSNIIAKLLKHPDLMKRLMKELVN